MSEQQDLFEHRRHADRTLEALEEKIISLIEQTDDNKDKAYLLILMKINDSLSTNTNNINKITNKLKEITDTIDSRIKTEEALLNRGRGWRDILVWVFGGIQAIALSSLVYLNAELKDIRHEQVEQKVELISHISSEPAQAIFKKEK